ncbi:hypothetical protein G7Y89_g4426 [Cudoniella acicularis]|uniref:Copper acquisition factor BIM1-like domain-containing protein n=1 Tax=Cudoniella acicularis TaxID=354080 RepID=A0A8H4W7G7_9HELO|nr:hypothetical protein G7Y89_g4426 [Cudoniella acicularis]
MIQPLARLSCLIAVLVTQCSAHFYLNYPTTIGFDDSLEGDFPCGSFTPDFTKDNITSYHVGGDTLALTSIHPQATWLFRATLDLTAQSNYTNLRPAIQQTGLGDFCETNINVPASWAGSKGIINIVQDAPDGILYQCAAVTFVTGVATSIPSSCDNVTGLSAAYTADPLLSALGPSATATGSTTGTSATASSTAKSSSNSMHAYSSGFGPAVWAFVVGSATFIACLFITALPAVKSQTSCVFNCLIPIGLADSSGCDDVTENCACLSAPSDVLEFFTNCIATVCQTNTAAFVSTATSLYESYCNSVYGSVTFSEAFAEESSAAAMSSTMVMANTTSSSSAAATAKANSSTSATASTTAKSDGNVWAPSVLIGTFALGSLVFMVVL